MINFGINGITNSQYIAFKVLFDYYYRRSLNQKLLLIELIRFNDSL